MDDHQGSHACGQVARQGEQSLDRLELSEVDTGRAAVILRRRHWRRGALDVNRSQNPPAGDDGCRAVPALLISLDSHLSVVVARGETA